MRNNGPVTNQEVELSEGDLLVSRTDASGKITFVNQKFIDIVGTPSRSWSAPPAMSFATRHAHGGVRRSLVHDQSRRPLEGLDQEPGKVRQSLLGTDQCSPLIEGGEISGFIWIRSKPVRAQVDPASAPTPPDRQIRQDDRVHKGT